MSSIWGYLARLFGNKWLWKALLACLSINRNGSYSQPSALLSTGLYTNRGQLCNYDIYDVEQ